MNGDQRQVTFFLYFIVLFSNEICLFLTETENKTTELMTYLDTDKQTYADLSMFAVAYL